MVENNDTLKEERTQEKDRLLQIINSLISSPTPLSLPIDLNLLIKNIESLYDLKIIVQEKPLDSSLSGTMVRNGNTVGILINKNHNTNRKRFTMAHELGHVCLRHKLNLAYYEEKVVTNKKSPYEIEANSFASEILMPAKKVKALLKEKKFSSVDSLATFLIVSKEALWYKLVRDRLDKYL